MVNSGGVIQVADELGGFSLERARAGAARIFDTTKKILAIADEEDVPPAVAADRLAERRMSEVGRLRGIWLGARASWRGAAPRRRAGDNVIGPGWPEARAPQSRDLWMCTEHRA